MSVILIGGGSRSGKSSHALTVARGLSGRLAFIATAQAYDEEMRERISRHRQDRGSEFITFEEPLDVAALLLREAANFDVFVVDCLTLWLSNMLFAEGRDAGVESHALLAAAAQSSASVILVTNEVGCGIVPENELARQFRDLAGHLNQDAARAATEVYWMVFGIALKLK